MAEQLVLGSPEWWLARLHPRLSARRDRLTRFDRYYTGDHPLLFATERYRQAFHGMLAHLSDNWCGVVVDAVEERLNVQGFRLSGDPADVINAESEAGDQAAWTIWQRNNLDSGSQMGHAEALIGGYANVLVWGDKDGKAIITPEHPLQTIVENYPGTRTRAAALKEWRDDWTDRLMASIYLPDGIYKFVSERKVRADDWTDRIRWARRDVEGEDWPLTSSLGVVPMIPLPNRERLLAPYASELQGVTSIQDLINKFLSDMVIASEYQSFRQRWATGIEIPVDPKTQQPVEAFKAAVDRLWLSDDPETKFGEFEQADLRIFVAAIEMLVQHVASQSRTPPHYFYLSGQFPSGESIKSAETGLVAKTKRRMTHFGEAWEDVIRLAFKVEGDARASAFAAETIWADPESRSEAEHTDSMIKLVNLGVPKEALWGRWGFSPQEIARFKAMREAEAALEPAPVLTIAPPAPALIAANGGRT